MVIRFRPVAPLLLAILAACRTAAPPPAIRPALAARVPAATAILAGIDLDQLRLSPLYARLPAAQTLLAPFDKARELLVASPGLTILAIARGAIPGATQPEPGISLYGAPDLIAAATANHAPAAILAPAESVAPGHAFWIAIRGGIALPLEGNLANLNNLLRGTDYITLAIQLDDPVAIDIVAHCPTPAAALHFDQSLRALASLTAAANARDPQLAAALHSLRISQTGSVVRASASAPVETLSHLLSR